MILVSILYPAGPTARFDFEYYAKRHMPRAVELLGAHPGYQGVTIEKGLSAAQPGEGLKFIAACTYQFRSVDDFIAAFMPVARELQSDIANYTNIEPLIQFNERLVISGA
jgi:uncharacterized protein (TIGR02118 family)